MSAPQHPLVELAHSSLALLAEVPRFGEDSRESATLLERAWVRAPLSVAIGGPIAARTALVNYLCDRKVLDPDARPLSSPGLRIRRGRSRRETRFRATRDDGTTEEHVLPPEHADDDALRLRAASAKATVDERQLALQRVEKALPRFARARPRGLMIWLWPLWWLVTRRQRRALGERQLTEHAYDVACDELKNAAAELATSAERIRIERGRFFESLRALSSGTTLGGRVREVELVLGEGPLPPGVDLVEMSRPKMSERVDAILIIERDTFYAPHTAGDPPVVGPIAELIPGLLGMLGTSRAVLLAKQAQAELEPAVAALEDDINDTEETFRVRIERLEAMQVLDPEEFARAELVKVRGQVRQGTRAVIERSAALLAAELDRLGASWSTALSISQDTDGLKAAIARIEQSAPNDARRIADEVRTLLLDRGAHHAADVLPDLLAALKPHGLDEALPREPLPLPPFEILPSLSQPAVQKKLAGFMAGLFRSFESRRVDVLTKAEQRIATLREAAAAEMLGAEPRLRDAVEQVLHHQLRAAIERQVAWLERTLTAEREAVAADGLALAPLARTRDRLKADLAKLAAGIAQIERESPGLAAAAAAAIAT